MSDSLDGLLAVNTQAKFERHLNACTSCRTFHADMKGSLLLLEDLPAVEVDTRFDDAVWARVRAEEAPRDLWHVIGNRVADGWRGTFLGTSIWKWSPVGVAAGILLMFAIASEPPAPPSGASEVAGNRVPARSAVSSGESIRAETNRVLAELGARPAHEEVVAGIPEAVERYLQTARDLRLPADGERFRRSNYSYPLRRFQDPSFLPVTEAVPGRSVRPSGPATREQSPGTISF